MELNPNPADWGFAIAVMLIVLGLMMTGKIVPGSFYTAERERADKADAALRDITGSLTEIRHVLRTNNDRHEQLAQLLTNLIQR